MIVSVRFGVDYPRAVAALAHRRFALRYFDSADPPRRPGRRWVLDAIRDDLHRSGWYGASGIDVSDDDLVWARATVRRVLPELT